VVGGLVFWSFQSSAADKALGAALDTYDAPLLQPGAPAEAGTYASAADRFKGGRTCSLPMLPAKYGYLPEGAKAHYFAGITDEDLGRNAQAETELKTAAVRGITIWRTWQSWRWRGSNHRTQRDQQAIAIYNELTSKPSETVSANVAQLDLADLYAGQGTKRRRALSGPRSRMATRTARRDRLRRRSWGGGK